MLRQVDRPLFRTAALVLCTHISRSSPLRGVSAFASPPMHHYLLGWPMCTTATTSSGSAFSSSNRWFSSSTGTTTTIKSKANNSDGDDDALLWQRPIPPTPEELERESQDRAIADNTRAWVNRMVIGLNLCPWAAKPMIRGQVFVEVVRSNNDNRNVDDVYVEDVLGLVLAQALKLKQPSKAGDTSLVVCPDLYPDNFLAFLDVLDMVNEGVLMDHQLTEYIQVVPFHPQFVFGEEEHDDNDDEEADETQPVDHAKIEYWTNQAPYPMFHVLQEADVSQAVARMNGRTDRVWKRNVELLNRLEKEAAACPHALQEYLQKGKPNEQMERMVHRILEEIQKEFPLNPPDN